MRETKRGRKRNLHHLNGVQSALCNLQNQNEDQRPQLKLLKEKTGQKKVGIKDAMIRSDRAMCHFL